jgi:hypothetical protein
MNNFNAARSSASLLLVGLALLAELGCGERSQPATPPKQQPAIFKPQEMADALHAVIAADRDACAQFALQQFPPGDQPGSEVPFMSLHARLLRQASDAIQQKGAEFHYVLRSLSPINPQAAPETNTERTGLQYVADHPGTNFYSEEELGGRLYFTAVYPEAATHSACVNCHNRNASSPKRDFRLGDVMGGLVVRVPMEF